MNDIEQQRVVEDFGNTERPVRLLLCSDAASEGINLHFHCHRLIHFDMPWSLMVFQQRNGRVDRYGQPRTPRIVYLVTESANETIRGDTRILEVLEEKDQQAYENVGDPSAFMNVHDIELETKITEEAIANEEDPSHFDERLTPSSSEGEELLALFLGTGGEAATVTNAPDEPPPPPRSLFASDLRYCEAALHRHRARNGIGSPDYVPNSSCDHRPRETGDRAAPHRCFRRPEHRFAPSGEPSRSVAVRVRCSDELGT